MNGTVTAVGEQALLEGYGLAGARVLAAETDDEVRAAWASLRGTAAVVLLTPGAARALGAAPADPAAPLTAVLPS